MPEVVSFISFQQFTQASYTTTNFVAGCNAHKNESILNGKNVKAEMILWKHIGGMKHFIGTLFT